MAIDPFSSARAMAAAVAARQVSSLELVEMCLGRIARDDKRINAVVTVDGERARARAREADGAARALEAEGARVEERLPAADFARHRAIWLEYLRFAMQALKEIDEELLAAATTVDRVVAGYRPPPVD